MLNDGWLTICALASSYPIKVVQLSSSNLTAHDKEQPSSSRQGHRSDFTHSQAPFKLVIFRRFARSEFGTPPKSLVACTGMITTAAGTRRPTHGSGGALPMLRKIRKQAISLQVQASLKSIWYRHPLAKRVASQLTPFTLNVAGTSVGPALRRGL